MKILYNYKEYLIFLGKDYTMTEISRIEKKKKKSKKWLKITGAVLLVLLLGLGAYAFSIWNSLSGAVDKMHTPLDRTSEKRADNALELSKQEPFSVLLLGVDEREGDKGRSDTMITLAVNPNNKNIKMLSIPRDTRTEIIGKGFDDKINHAFAFGGPKMAMDTVENFLDIPIDYYIKINMEGFKDIIDAVGDVTVENDLDFTYEGVHFPKGTLTLNGEEALKYSRMRYEDPRQDFGRQLRQRQIIEAIIKKGASFSSLTRFGDIFGALGNNIETNLSFSEMMDIQKNYREAAGSLEQMTIASTGTKIKNSSGKNIYYGIVSDEERKRVQNEMKTQLEIKD